MKKIYLLFFLLLSSIAGLNAQTVILTENFEGGSLPAGWANNHATPSVGWEFGDNLGSQYFPIPAHTKYAASNDDAHDDNTRTKNDASMDYLVTPVMNFTAYAGMSIVSEFAYLQTAAWGSSGTIEVSTDGGTTWNVAQTVAPTTSWAHAIVNLTSYAGQTSVRVGFHHDDGGGWADGFAVDDVVVRTLPSIDASVEMVTIPPFVVSGNTSVTGEIFNQGSSTINTLTLSYAINGGAPVNQNLTGLNMPSLTTYNFTHGTAANLPTPGAYEIRVWISNVNGTTDADQTNDTLVYTVNVLSQIPVHRSILEDHTGAWCQFCPDGAVVGELVLTTHSNSIMVGVHSGDAMEFAEGLAIATEYITGYPGGTIDHKLMPGQPTVELNRGDWVAEMGNRLAMTVPVGIEITARSFNASTREISVSVRGNFYGPVTGDLRFNVYIIEDSVVGSGPGYDQVNYYNNTAGHPYNGAGNPILGFVHEHVLRAMLGGSWGTPGTIPPSVNDGQSFNQTFTYTLPVSYDENHVKVIAVVQRYDDLNAENREIYNSVEEELLAPVGRPEAQIAKSLSVFPNPFSRTASIDFSLDERTDVTVEVMDVTGKTVKVLSSGYMRAGEHHLSWDATNMNGQAAANGLYMIVLKAQGNTVMERVILSR